MRPGAPCELNSLGPLQFKICLHSDNYTNVASNLYLGVPFYCICIYISFSFSDAQRYGVF